MPFKYRTFLMEENKKLYAKKKVIKKQNKIHDYVNWNWRKKNKDVEFPLFGLLLFIFIGRFSRIVLFCLSCSFACYFYLLRKYVHLICEHTHTPSQTKVEKKKRKKLIAIFTVNECVRPAHCAHSEKQRCAETTENDRTNVFGWEFILFLVVYICSTGW